jgi:adenylate cyclase
VITLYDKGGSLLTILHKIGEKMSESSQPGPVEIERKFLVRSDEWREGAQGETICQGYLNSVKERTVRVRISGDKAFLTIKGPAINLTRPEFEYEIPVTHANQMLDELCEQPLLKKTRYKVLHDGKTWEVDEFHGANDGLVVAEIELDSEDETIRHPEWVGTEVTKDPKYFNSSLISKPFSTW